MSVYRQLIAVISTVILLLVSLWTAISIHRQGDNDRTDAGPGRSGATSLAISMTEVLRK